MTIDATLPRMSADAPTTDEIMAAHDGGKLATGLTAPLRDDRDLSISYTPGVAQVSRAIAADAGLRQRDTHATRPAYGPLRARLGAGNLSSLSIGADRCTHPCQPDFR